MRTAPACNIYYVPYIDALDNTRLLDGMLDITRPPHAGGSTIGLRFHVLSIVRTITFFIYPGDNL